MEIGRSWRWMVGVAALAVGAACGGSDNGDGGGAGDIPADANPPAAEVSFEQQIHPVLVAKCGACHGTAWGSPNVNTSYQAALLEVETSTPTNSDLYERGNGGGGHAKVFSDAEAALVLQWIQQGAKGPATTPTAPQTTVSFSTQVHPILTTSCTPCHSGTFASSTGATSFAEAQTRVNTGAPAQSALLQKGNAQVAHGGGDKLSDADAQTILTWIQEGATNN
jgi:cytochrome c5